jgi:4-amino-4-deoxy-L-arabinose transferase-like glycosyltransferase
VDRSNNTDSCLVLTQILAAWPLIMASKRASLPLLLLSAVLLGLSFNVKMAAAFLVLPGFIALYAFTAPIPWGRRIAHLTAAAAVLIVVSLSWTMEVDLTPPAARPYVDSTRDNSMLELVIRHNAVDRFVRPDWLRFVVPPNASPPGIPAGPLRLTAPRLASQMGWLAILALAGLWLCRAWSGRLLWGGWACACGIVFSAAGGIFLPHYLADMAPPLAVLAAIGVTSLQRRRDIAAVIVLSAAWQAYIVWGVDVGWRAWLIGVPAGAALIATLLLAVDRAAITGTAIALGVAGLLAAPLAWSIGPVLARGSPTFPKAQFSESRLASMTWRSPSLIGDGLGNRTRLLEFLLRERGATRFVLATTAISEASSVIIRTGDPVMALGGYTGTTPVISQAELARRIDAGEVRFVLIGGSAAADPASPSHPLVKWVRDTGREINPSIWRPATSTGSGPLVQRRATWLQGLSLYDLRPE